jgi:hypothetical protein
MSKNFYPQKALQDYRMRDIQLIMASLSDKIAHLSVILNAKNSPNS